MVLLSETCSVRVSQKEYIGTQEKADVEAMVFVREDLRVLRFYVSRVEKEDLSPRTYAIIFPASDRKCGALLHVANTLNA
jgi:hypothetical protein